MCVRGVPRRSRQRRGDTPVGGAAGVTRRSAGRDGLQSPPRHGTGRACRRRRRHLPPRRRGEGGGHDTGDGGHGHDPLPAEVFLLPSPPLKPCNSGGAPEKRRNYGGGGGGVPKSRMDLGACRGKGERSGFRSVAKLKKKSKSSAFLAVKKPAEQVERKRS